VVHGTLNRRGHGRDSELVGVVDRCVTLAAGCMEAFEKRLNGARRIRAVLARFSETLARHDFECLFIGEARQPSLPIGAAEQSHFFAGVRRNVVAQSAARALGLRDPDKSLAFNEAHPREFPRTRCQLVQDGLNDFRDASVGEVGQAKSGDLEREAIGIEFTVLSDITLRHQLRQYAVRSASRYAEMIGDGVER
jgi:hypothetical protein